MTDILIYGINGKMGKTVYSVAASTADINVACGVDEHTMGDFNCPVFRSLKDVSVHFDLILDFSSPAALDDIIAYAEENACPAVLATTGYTERQLDKIYRLSKKVPVCLTPNTSRGIGALKEILPLLQKMLYGFDCTIIETHGQKKKDAPSGTAMYLAEALTDCTILSARGGDVAGVHEINFYGGQEIITIKHTVLSREVFAEGALELCKKIVGMPAGLYGKNSFDV